MARGHLYPPLQTPFNLGHRSVEFEESLDILGQLCRFSGIRIFHVHGRFAWARIKDLGTDSGPIHFVDKPLLHPPSSGAAPASGSEFSPSIARPAASNGEQSRNTVAKSAKVSSALGDATRLTSIMMAFMGNRALFQCCKISYELFEAKLVDACKALGIKPPPTNPFQDLAEECLIAVMTECEMADKDNDLECLLRICSALSPLAEELQQSENHGLLKGEGEHEQELE
jgi:hypothetical protein